MVGEVLGRPEIALKWAKLTVRDDVHVDVFEKVSRPPIAANTPNTPD
jgi:hypothetical protein